MKRKIIAIVMSAIIATGSLTAFAEEVEDIPVVEESAEETALPVQTEAQPENIPDAELQESTDVPIPDAEIQEGTDVPGISTATEEAGTEEIIPEIAEEDEAAEDIFVIEDEMPVESSANASALPEDALISDEIMEAAVSDDTDDLTDAKVTGYIEMPVLLPTDETIRHMSSPETGLEAKSANQKTFQVEKNDTDSEKREKALQAMGDDDGEVVTESIEEACLCAAGYYDNYENAFEGIRGDLYSLAEKALKGVEEKEYTETFTKDHTFLCETQNIDNLKASYNTEKTAKAVNQYMLKNEDLKNEFQNVMLDALTLVGYDNPEYYWTRNFYFSYSWHMDIDEPSNSVTVYVTSLTLEPKEFFPGAIARQKKALNAIKGIYLTLCTTGNSDINYDGKVSDYEYLLALHDYIRKNTYYDFSRLDSFYANPGYDNPSRAIFTPDALFNKKTGGMICDGYARAFKIFCDKRKIKSFVAISKSHAWNLVYFDGDWYTVDVTWDDGLGSGYKSWEYYTYFLCGTDTARKGNQDHNIADIPVQTVKVTVPSLSKTDYGENASEHKLRDVRTYSGKGSIPCSTLYITEYECETCGTSTKGCEEALNDGTENDGHVYGNWKIITKPTYTKTGVKLGSCKYCHTYERYASIPALDPRLKVSKPSNKKISIKKGKTFQIKASSKTGIIYSSTNKKVATVTAKGKVKGVKKGTCKIKVKSGTKTIKIKVTIK